MARASSPPGTFFPTISGNNLSAVGFSWRFPPVLSLAAKFFWIRVLIWKCVIFLCLDIRVKYYCWIISWMHKTNSTGSISSNRLCSTPGRKPEMGWKITLSVTLVETIMYLSASVFIMSLSMLLWKVWSCPLLRKTFVRNNYPLVMPMKWTVHSSGHRAVYVPIL